MRLLISSEARCEFEAAERYYELQVPGLGVELREETRAALRRLRRWPLAFPVERGGDPAPYLESISLQAAVLDRTGLYLSDRRCASASQTRLLVRSSGVAMIVSER